MIIVRYRIIIFNFQRNVVKSEERGHGRISFRTYIDYFRAGGGFLSMGIFFSLVLLTEVNNYYITQSDIHTCHLQQLL